MLVAILAAALFALAGAGLVADWLAGQASPAPAAPQRQSPATPSGGAVVRAPRDIRRLTVGAPPH
jgi:hypothetical protein